MVKKFIKLNLAIMLTLTAGCGTDFAGKAEKQESIPETEAFKNEFTREFMKSTEETEDGFYTFESKTKGYTMNFPENATLDQVFYELEGSHFENMLFGADDNDNNTTYSLNMTYENQPVNAEIEANLSLVSDSVNYSGEYLKEELPDKTIYYAEKTSKSKNGETTFYEIFGYVKSADSDQAVSFTSAVSCLKTEKTCSVDVTKEEMNTMDLIGSVAFIN